MLWWIVGAVLMLTGSLLRHAGLFWLYWAGLIPAAISLTRLTNLRRSSAPASLWFLFGFGAFLGVLLTGLSPFGIVLLGINVFVGRALKARLAKPDKPPSLPTFSLLCINGELAGNMLELSGEPIVIGRVPDKANIVIPLREISGSHVRVWVDIASNNVLIEDLKSRNGTYVRKASGAGWQKIEGRESLSRGDRFYLGAEDLAAFEIGSGV